MSTSFFPKSYIIFCCRSVVSSFISLVDGYLGCFQVFAVISNTTMNNLGHAIIFVHM